MSPPDAGLTASLNVSDPLPAEGATNCTDGVKFIYGGEMVTALGVVPAANDAVTLEPPSVYVVDAGELDGDVLGFDVGDDVGVAVGLGVVLPPPPPQPATSASSAIAAPGINNPGRITKSPLFVRRVKLPIPDSILPHIPETNHMGLDESKRSSPNSQPYG